MAQANDQFGSGPTVEVPPVVRDFYQESRKFAVEFYKHCFLVSAGALTLSAGLILRADPPQISAELLWYLKASWMLLTACMVGAVLAFGVVMFFLGWIGEQAQAMVAGKRRNAPDPTWMNRLGLGLDAFVALTCVAGICLLAYFAIGLVKVSG